MAKLILLIGVPGSGKSSLATQVSQNGAARSLVYSVISTDAIRAKLFGDEAVQGSWELVWREVQQQFRQAAEQIAEGRSQAALYDATNARRKSRREAIALARITGFTHVTGLWLDTPLWLCLERNRQRSRQVPDAVIQQMQRQLLGAPPHLQDGMDCLIRYACFSQKASKAESISIDTVS